MKVSAIVKWQSCDLAPSTRKSAPHLPRAVAAIRLLAFACWSAAAVPARRSSTLASRKGGAMPSSASRENFLSATTEELEKLTGAEAGTSGAASSSAVAAHPGRSPLALPTALFYGATSIGIIACNKITLTTYAFPSSSALALAQFAVTCACLGALALAGAVELAPPTADSFRVVVPLTALFVADVLMGLFATGSLSLPMFTVLRRFSIPCTMLLERFVGQANPSPLVQASVWGMVGGAVVAAYDDLAFDAKGYAAVLLNDLFTALRGVYVKAALPSVTRTPRSSEKKDVEAQDPAAPRPPPKLSKLSLLFYNALLGGAVLAPYLAYTGELAEARVWLEDAPSAHAGGHPVAALALSASLGPVLQYAIFVCTQHNSALTTTVVGALKNVATTYVGMFLGGDYSYSYLNFGGITLSCLASLVYSWAVIVGRRLPTAPPAEPAAK